MADRSRASWQIKKLSRGSLLSRRVFYSLTLAGIATCCFAAAFVSGTATSKPTPLVPQFRVAAQPETLLVKSLLEIQNNRMDSALNEIEALVKTNPNFRLAQLIKGDLLLARAHPLTTLGNATDVPEEQIDDLRQEAKVRLQRYQQEVPYNEIPKYLLQLDREQKHAIVVDLSRATLYLYENQGGKVRYVSDYYITIGKNGFDKVKEGDKKTPIGVYFVIDNLPPQKLADLYGKAAYPLSYPNEWDRIEGRAGHGIWLHGTPSDTYSRPPRASDGCVVLTNQDLEALAKNLQIGITPVIIANGVEWSPPENVEQKRVELQKQLETWRHDWESLDTTLYLQHYARNFKPENQNREDWIKQKYKTNNAKTWAKIKIDEISMFQYPGKNDMAVVTFRQDYSSNNFNYHMKKRQYWILENRHWKIAYEGTA